MSLYAGRTVLCLACQEKESDNEGRERGKGSWLVGAWEGKGMNDANVKELAPACRRKFGKKKSA